MTVGRVDQANGRLAGMLCMFSASACSVTMSALVKGLGEALPLTELMFLRTVIALPFLLGVQIYRGRPLLVNNRKLLLLRALFGVSAMYCFYYALTHMPLADCVFIGRTQPLLLALLAPLLVAERTPRRVWLAILLGLAGTLLVVRPGAAWSTAAWVALAASFFSALAHLMVRRLHRSDGSGVIVLNFTFLLALVSGALAWPVFRLPEPEHWGMIIGISLFASAGQALMTRAYCYDRAPAIAASSYASVILSVCYGWWFWDEVPVALTWGGGGLIVLGGLVLLLARRRS